MNSSVLSKRPTRLALIAVLAAVTGGAGFTAANAGGGLGCEINVSHGRSGVTLSGIVHAAKDADGSYTFRVSKSGGGSSDISQSGDFSVSAGSTESVGEVSLDGSGTYRARLDIRSSYGSTSCSERVSGGL